MKFYGQNKEDKILYYLFNGKKDGFYIDVGAFDGIEISNTYIFDQMGWKGICFEAHPEIFKKLEKNRTDNSILYNMAVSDNSKKDVDFWIKGRVSTLNKEIKKKKFKKSKVKTISLNEVLDNFKDVKIDFISIDVEGHEKEVLNGFDIQKYKPEIILIEVQARKYKFNYDDILTSNGYKKIYSIGANEFWCVENKFNYYNNILGDLNEKQ